VRQYSFCLSWHDWLPSPITPAAFVPNSAQLKSCQMGYETVSRVSTQNLICGLIRDRRTHSGLLFGAKMGRPWQLAAAAWPGASTLATARGDKEGTQPTKSYRGI